MIFETVSSGYSLFYGSQMCMEFAAPSSLSRKSHAHSGHEVNFFCGNHYVTSQLRFSDAFALVG